MNISDNPTFAGKWSLKSSGGKFINLECADTGALNLAAADDSSPNPQYFNTYGDETTGLWLQAEANQKYVIYSGEGYYASQKRGNSDLATFALEKVSDSVFRIIQQEGNAAYYLSENGDKLDRIAKSDNPPDSTAFTQSIITPAQPPGTSSDLNLVGVYLSGTDITSWASNGRPLISNGDLSYADLSGATITNVNFSFSKLDGTNLSNCALDGTNFSQVKGTGTVFTGCKVYANTSFSSAQFDKAFFNKISNTLNNPTTNEGAKFNGAFVATNSIFSDSNLAGSTFMGNLSGSQLVSVNLQNSILTGTNFSNCVMSLITFSGNGGDAVTQANNCNFENAVLTQALFDKANLQGSSFKNANLTNAKLDEVLGIIGIDLSGTNLTAANLTGLDLSSNPPAKHGTGGNVVITSDTNFTKAQMNHVDLSNQKLDGVNFLAASMQFAKCTTCSFEKSILVGADLTSATFSANTSFLEANLSNVVLANCDLSGANFSADTQGTNAAILTNAYMPNAVLTDAKLYAVNMSGCSWYGPASKANKAQMEQVNLSNANLATLDLSQAVMIGANLTFANMVNSNLTGVDLTPTQDNRSTSLAFASLQGTNFTQAQLTNADLTNAAVSLDIQSSSGFMKGNLAFTVKGSDTVTITSITSDLSRLIIDDYLISAFAENGVTIDAKNGISIVTAGVSWLIRDSDGKQFILVFDTNKILVYKEATDGATKVAYGNFVAVPLFPIDYKLLSDLNGGDMSSDLKKAFSSAGYELQPDANITIVAEDNRWAISNRSQKENALESGYGQFVLLEASMASGSIKYVQVYGANPLLVTQKADNNVLNTGTINFNSTTQFNNSIMGPETTCPSGLKFELLEDDPNITYQQLMTAGLPPGPPACIPSPTHWC